MLRYLISIRNFCIICRHISWGLNHGLPLEKILSQLSTMFRFPDTVRNIKNCRHSIAIGEDIHHALDHILPIGAPLRFSTLGQPPNLAHLCTELDRFYTRFYDFLISLLRQLRYPLVLLGMLIIMAVFFKFFLVDNLAQLLNSGHDASKTNQVNTPLLGLLALNIPLIVILSDWRSLLRQAFGIKDFEYFYLFGFLSVMIGSGISMWTCCERLTFPISSVSKQWTLIRRRLGSGEGLEDIFLTQLNLDDYDRSILQASLPLQERFEHLSNRFFDKLNRRYDLLANALKPMLLLLIASLITYMILTYFSPLLDYNVIFNY